MHLSLSFPINQIPFWFLVLSLFLPRLCIAVAWYMHNIPAFIPSTVGIIPILVWLLVPRLLILFWIYTDQGITIWFLLHVVGLIMAWGGGGHRMSRRRRFADD